MYADLSSIHVLWFVFVIAFYHMIGTNTFMDNHRQKCRRRRTPFCRFVQRIFSTIWMKEPSPFAIVHICVAYCWIMLHWILKPEWFWWNIYTHIHTPRVEMKRKKRAKCVFRCAWWRKFRETVPYFYETAY